MRPYAGWSSQDLWLGGKPAASVPESSNDKQLLWGRDEPLLSYLLMVPFFLPKTTSEHLQEIHQHLTARQMPVG